MNFFNGIFRSKSSSIEPSLCTPCCPFDTNDLPHPRYSLGTNTGDSCCLTKMRVKCRIRYPKKKRKLMKSSRQSSIRSSPSSNRSVSLSSAMSSPSHRFDGSSINTNYHRDDRRARSSSSSSSISSNQIELETSSDDDESMEEKRTRKVSKNQNYQLVKHVVPRSDLQTSDTRHLDEKIEKLKHSIDQLTQIIVRPTPSNSWIDRIRRIFRYFQSSSINDECCRILDEHHLNKSQLIGIYQLFDRNETIFLQWLRTFLPEHLVPLLFNYVQHFSTSSSSSK